MDKYLYYYDKKIGSFIELITDKTPNIVEGNLSSLDLVIDHYIKMGLINKKSDLFVEKLRANLKNNVDMNSSNREKVLKSAQKIAQKMYKFGIKNPLVNNLRAGNFDESIDILDDKLIYSIGTNLLGISRNNEFIRMKVMGCVYKVNTKKAKHSKFLYNIFNR